LLWLLLRLLHLLFKEEWRYCHHTLPAFAWAHDRLLLTAARPRSPIAFRASATGGTSSGCNLNHSALLRTAALLFFLPLTPGGLHCSFLICLNRLCCCSCPDSRVKRTCCCQLGSLNAG
jgi:hypothetical protein